MLLIQEIVYNIIYRLMWVWKSKAVFGGDHPPFPSKIFIRSSRWKGDEEMFHLDQFNAYVFHREQIKKAENLHLLNPP